MVIPAGGIINLFKYRHSFDSDNQRCSIITLDKLEEMVHTKYDLSRSDSGSVTISPRGASEIIERKNKNLYKNCRYPPIELLILTQFALTRDVSDIKLDYLFLHKCCFTVLHALYSAIHPAFKGEFRPSYLQGDDNLPQMISCILCLGVPLKQVQKVMKPQFSFIDMLPSDFKTVLSQREILKHVGQLMQNKIENGRFHSQLNSRVRQMRGTSEVLIYEYQEDMSKGARLTFKNHKPTFHKSTACTKSKCVCGATSKQAKKKE